MVVFSLLFSFIIPKTVSAWYLVFMYVHVCCHLSFHILVSYFLELGMLSILVNDGQSVQYLCSNVGYLVSMKTPGVSESLFSSCDSHASTQFYVSSHITIKSPKIISSKGMG